MPKIPKVILLIETSRAYGRGLLQGIAKYARLHGPWVFYNEPGGLATVMPKMKHWNADGIIMRQSRRVSVALKSGAPFIISSHQQEPPKDTPFITTDDVKIGRMAAEYLLDRGFQYFAFCGFDDIYWSRNRCKNFSKRIAESGFETHIYKQPKSRTKRLWENEQVTMADWLKSLPKPVGVMTCNDDRSHHVSEACKTAGLGIPEQVAILGVDNDELACELSDSPLSSVALNVQKGGYEAAELLDKLMAGEKPKKQTIIIEPTHIVTRRSTDILAIEDHEVAEAVSFICRHSKEPIQVNDVVNEIALSRRVLERRFRKVLNRSVLGEIRRVRIEQVARMLVETNLPISRIASALGYYSVENIGRYFRREKGMSPLAYRKQYGPK